MGTGNDITSPMWAWARELAGRGWAVFPLNPGSKTPAVRHWETRATTDPEQIRAWAAQMPGANLAVACGPSGLLVIDCDTVKPGEQVPGPARAGRVDTGVQVLRGMAGRHGHTVAPTFTVTTASGGWHLYYRQPAGAALRNTAGTLGWKLDSRGHGGYVVAPGSVLPHGGYELFDDRDPATLPGWLHQGLTVRPAPARTAPHQKAAVHRDSYVAAALTAEATAVRNAPQTQRNHILCRSAYALGQLVGAGVLDTATARAALETAWASWTPPGSASKDLGPGGVIDTSLAAGAANPRRITRRPAHA